MKSILTYLLLLSFIGWGCSTSSKKEKNNNGQTQAQSVQSSNNGLTPFQLKNGIGPITQEIKVEGLDKKLAAKGKNIFENKCTSCHKIGKRYVGPNLQKVTSRRTPTYIMNMILNPSGMTAKHPVARKLLEKFATQMANMHLTKEQARAVVEYFRSVNTDKKK